jgi:hypothetical protein
MVFVREKRHFLKRFYQNEKSKGYMLQKSSGIAELHVHLGETSQWNSRDTLRNLCGFPFSSRQNMSQKRGLIGNIGSSRFASKIGPLRQNFRIEAVDNQAEWNATDCWPAAKILCWYLGRVISDVKLDYTLLKLC